MRHTTDEAAPEDQTTIEPCDRGSQHDHLDKTLQSLSAGIARIERKLDRILALAVESRTRPRL